MAKNLVCCLVLGLLCAPISAMAQGEEPTVEQAMAQITSLQEKIKSLEDKLAALEGKDTASSADLAKLRGEMEALKGDLDKAAETAMAGLEKASAIEAGLQAADEQVGFELGLTGYLRTEVVAIFQGDDDKTSFIGLNDGFTLGNARLGVVGAYEDFSFLMQFDGAVDRRDARNSAAGDVKTELKDAWFSYAPSKYANLSVGQFKPPFDGEEQRSTTDLLFVSRSVASRGVSGVEGPAVAGLSVDRQVGLMLSSEVLKAEGGSIGGSYALALTNGNASNQPLNDNESLAFYGRLELVYDDLLRVGVGGYFNVLTDVEEEVGDLVDEEKLGITADLEVTVSGVIFAASFIQVTTSFPDQEVQVEQTGRGFHFELGYDILEMGIIPAYRLAFFDPTADFAGSSPDVAEQLGIDELTHHTLGLTWNIPEVPVKLQANYTITIENQNRVFDNDRLELLGQLLF